MKFCFVALVLRKGSHILPKITNSILLHASYLHFQNWNSSTSTNNQYLVQCNVMLVPMVKPVLAISVLIKSSRLELLYYAVYSRHQRPEGSHHLRKHEQVNRNIYSLYKPVATGLQTTYIWQQLWINFILFLFCSVFFSLDVLDTSKGS